ncbi:MAG: DUF2617 domain-containing protein [Planctomycetaceae bacterium]|jgi:hypothetical protein|nr:DUF2617 domain-containing protein [Planctomycetaceae bacterium]
MTTQSVRPDASELVFHLFGRSVHPELLAVRAETEVWHEDYSASIHICDAGHMVSLRCRNETVTEVTAARQQLLPQKRQLLEKKIRGSRNETFQFDNGVRYYVSYQLEQLDQEVFLNVHEELARDSLTAAVAFAFPGTGRFDPAALSVITTDNWPGSLLVQAFHTFPENCAVVKTQSLFEL